MNKRMNNVYKITISITAVLILLGIIFIRDFKKGKNSAELTIAQNLNAHTRGGRHVKNGRDRRYARDTVGEDQHPSRPGFNDRHVGPSARGSLNNSGGEESGDIKKADNIILNEDDVDIDIKIDLSKVRGQYKDLLGINKSPYVKTRDGTKEIDFTNIYKMLDFSEIRMHDDEVDVCKIYQDDTAIETTTGMDVTESCKFTGKISGIVSVNWNVNNNRTINNIRNYDFSDADKAMKMVMNTGAKIYLRLGESWLGPNNTDEPRVFAAVANNIYKHYIGDFGSSSLLPEISAVEVHNEPDGRFWVGSNASLHSLVKNTIENVRISNSNEKVGGSGFVVKVNEHFIDRNSVVNKFIKNVGADNLDFLSAHYYGDCEKEELKNFIDWSETLRDNLDIRGMSDKEIHLTEWNIGTGNSCAGRDEVAYKLPKMFTFAAGLLLLAQEDELNIKHAHFYAGNGSAMSVLTLNQKNLTVLVNKVFMSFYLHKQFRGMNKIMTKICDGYTCLDSFENVKAGKHVLAQAYKNRDGFKILVINDSDATRTIKVNLSNLKDDIKNSYEIKYQIPEDSVVLNLEKERDGMYRIESLDVTREMIKKSLSKRKLNLTNDGNQFFLIQLKPYSASVVDVVNE